MRMFDVVVVGAGDVGLSIAFHAASAGLKVALIDKGNVGGTCVNNGCVPSKTLIHAADRIIEIRESSNLGIRAEIADIDFGTVMGRMRSAVAGGRSSIKKAIEDTEQIAFFGGEGHFLDERTIGVGSDKIRGKKIFIASGARPSVPPIKGLDKVRYLTNESVLELQSKPDRMVFIGGGYVGLEYAHFFSAMGTKVIIVDKNVNLLHFEEPEISDLLTTELGKRTELRMGVEIAEVRDAGSGYAVSVKDAASGKGEEIFADAVMVATGRKSNADLLKVENAGIETDKANFIKVDEYLRTNKKHIWAVGDAIGKAMFTHAGDKEAELAWHNATHRKKMRMDFGSVPHAVFTSPQIASVGLTEKQARKDHDILVGLANYSATVMGEAMGERKGFAKAIVEKGTERILGFHIIGPHAAMLIQEVVNAVILGGDIKSVTGCMHIFPALSNLIPEALENIE
jgi:mycothione reductase